MLKVNFRIFFAGAIFTISEVIDFHRGLVISEYINIGASIPFLRISKDIANINGEYFCLEDRLNGFASTLLRVGGSDQRF